MNSALNARIKHGKKNSSVGRRLKRATKKRKNVK